MHSLQEGQKTIFVVDDDPSMLQAVERLLEAFGWRIRIFEGAEPLLESGDAESASCFVFDIHLPDISGFELWAQLAKEGIERPVVFITAHDHLASRLLAEQLGAAAYFAKPFSGRSLVSAIEKAVRKGYTR